LTLVPPKTSGSGADGTPDEVPSAPDSVAPRPAESADAAGEGPGDPVEVAPVEHEPRRHPSTIGGAVYLVILAATIVGIVIVSTGRWRTGVHWMGGALVVASGVRAILPARDAGMLAVRNRWFDAALLVATGVALWILASSVPDV